MRAFIKFILILAFLNNFLADIVDERVRKFESSSYRSKVVVHLTLKDGEILELEAHPQMIQVCILRFIEVDEIGK